MVKWAGDTRRNHIYVLNAGHLAAKVYDEFAKVLQERGNVLSIRPTKVSKGFFRRKERKALHVWPSEGGDIYALVTAMAVGPDLYVGYVISPLKEELEEIEMQDLEAFTDILETTLKITLQKLGVTIE